MTQLAKGTFEVTLQPLAFEGADPQGHLARMAIDKRISGDLEATSKGEMLSTISGTKGSGGYVALERVSGTLHGRSGTFVLQHHGLMHRGTPTLSVTVVPDSGTGELTGIEGQFTIIIDGKQHSYEFAYQLPPTRGT